MKHVPEASDHARRTAAAVAATLVGGALTLGTAHAVPSPSPSPSAPASAGVPSPEGRTVESPAAVPVPSPAASPAVSSEPSPATSVADQPSAPPSPQASPAKSPGRIVDLNIVNFNDFHGRIDNNTVNFAGTIEQLRQEGGEDATLVLAAGDNIGASLFDSFIQKDQPTIDVLNAIGLQASAVGNHEFDAGWPDLRDRVIGASSPNAKWAYLGANVIDQATGAPALKEFEMFTLKGVKVAVVGAVTRDTPTLVSPGGVDGLAFTDPVEAVNKVAERLTDGNPDNGEADVVIATYHEEIDSDRMSADLDQAKRNDPNFARMVERTSPKVSAILQGHTHQEYVWDAPVPGQKDKTRPIVQTGSYGTNIGNIKIGYDVDNKEVVNHAARNVPRSKEDPAALVAASPRVAEVDRIVKAARETGAQIGNEKIATVTSDITTAYKDGKRDDRASESTLGNLVAQSLKETLASPERGGAEIGVVNPGGLRADLLKKDDGSITFSQANAVLPFVNNLSTLSLTGAQFKQVLEQQWQPDGSSRPYQHLGLSGNVSYTTDPGKPRGERVRSVMVDGKPLEMDRTYRIGTFSFLAAGGDNFAAFTEASEVKDSGLVDRDAWIEYLKAKSPITPDFARRAVQVDRDIPTELSVGQDLEFTVSNLDLTSLGSPKNERVVVKVAGQEIGSFPVKDGSAAIKLTVPASVAGLVGGLTVEAAPTGTVVTVPVTVAGAPSPSPSASPAPTGSPAPSPVVSPSASPDPTASPSASPVVPPTASPSATASPTGTASPTSTAQPSMTNAPTPSSTQQPTSTTQPTNTTRPTPSSTGTAPGLVENNNSGNNNAGINKDPQLLLPQPGASWSTENYGSQPYGSYSIPAPTGSGTANATGQQVPNTTSGWEMLGEAGPEFWIPAAGGTGLVAAGAAAYARRRRQG